VIGDGDGLGTLRLPLPSSGEQRPGDQTNRHTASQHAGGEAGRGDPPLGKKRLRGIERSAERAGNLERGAGLVWFGLGGVGCRTEEREEV
jgi:hypothetical protein